MSNDYYNGGSFPATGSPATSASMRAELASVTAGFDKLPTLTGNAGEIVRVNSLGTALETTTSLSALTVTDSGFVVQDNADATKQFRFEASGITTGNTRVLTVPNADTTLVGTDATQTLTNKTLTTPVLSATGAGTTAGQLGYSAGVFTFGNGSATKTVVTLDDTQTLTNKTLTSPTLTGTISGGLTFSGANTFGNASGQTFLASTTTTQDGLVVTGRAGGTTSFRVTLAPTTLTASRSVTFPDAAGAVVLDAATQTLTNKTINAANNTLTGVATLTGTETLTNKTLTTPVLSATGAGTTAGQLGYNGGVFTFGNGSATRTVTTLEDTQTISGVKTFSAANVFGNATGQTFLASTTTTQDGVILTGRAGGTTSLRVTISPTTLTASRAVTLPDAAGTVVLDGATQTLTNKTINLASNTLSTTLAQLNTAVSDADLTAQGATTIYVPALAMVSRTTNGAANGTAESATNKVMIRTLDFDAATAEYVQFAVRMPKSWNESTVTAFFLWSNAIGSGFVVWAIQAQATSDDDVIDSSWSTAVTVTDGVTAAGDLMQSAQTSAITPAGTPAENDLVTFQVYRDAANGSDTLAVDARLHGVVIVYTTNAANDA